MLSGELWCFVVLDYSINLAAVNTMACSRFHVPENGACLVGLGTTEVSLLPLPIDDRPKSPVGPS